MSWLKCMVLETGAHAISQEVADALEVERIGPQHQVGFTHEWYVDKNAFKQTTVVCIWCSHKCFELEGGLWLPSDWPGFLQDDWSLLWRWPGWFQVSLIHPWHLLTLYFRSLGTFVALYYCNNVLWPYIFVFVYLWLCIFRYLGHLYGLGTPGMPASTSPTAEEAAKIEEA